MSTLLKSKYWGPLVARLLPPIRNAFIGALLAAIISIFQTNYYQSIARILPSESKSAGSLSGIAAMALSMGLGGSGSGSQDSAYIDILGSRWMAESLLGETYTFHQRSWRFGAERERRTTLFEYLDVPNKDMGVRKLKTVFSYSRDPKSGLLTLTVETDSPDLSRAVALRAISLLGEFVLHRSQTRSGNKATFAEARLKDARAECDASEAALKEFMTANRNYQQSSDPQVKLSGTRLEGELMLRRQLVVSLSTMREQALIESKDDMPILNVLDEPNLPVLKSKPSRAVFVLGVGFAVLAASMLFQHRKQLQDLLMAE